MSAERPPRTPRRRPNRTGSGERQTGVALEACYRFLLWLVPTLEKFPRSQKKEKGPIDAAPTHRSV